MMIYMLIFILIWIVTAIVIGWIGSMQIDIMIEIKYLSNPFFHMGVSFEQHVEEDHVQQELIIGMFFVNVVVVFFKEIEA
jgi:hypothetical protein